MKTHALVYPKLGVLSHELLFLRPLLGSLTKLAPGSMYESIRDKKRRFSGTHASKKGDGESSVSSFSNGLVFFVDV